MIIPSFGPESYNEPHRDILARMNAFYAEAISTNLAFWSEGMIDTRMWAGDQDVWNMVYGNMGNVPANRRRQLSFNRIRRVISMIEGHQRRNRKSIIVSGVENADSQTADQFTKIIMNICKQEGILETISESFLGSLVTGMNLLHIWTDYRQDPVSGNIKVDNLAFNQFLIDPFWKKLDLSDCNTILKRSFLTHRQIVSLMPDRAEEIMALYPNESGARDGKFQFTAESYAYSYNNLLTYDEFYYRDFRKQKLLVDTRTGETLEWKIDDKEKLKRYLQQYPEVTVIENEVPTVKLAIIIQNKVFYEGPQPSGIDDYPFVPVVAYYAPQMESFEFRVQGVVRGLRSAQHLYNRRRIIELDILESQITSGWVYKEGQLVNPADVWNQTGQGKGIAVKQEYSIQDSLMKVEAPQIPPSMIQLSELLAKEVMEISGVNEELLGSALDDKAGVLSMLRQGAGLTTLQNLFDNLDHAQKLLGNLMINMIQTNYTPGKIQNILEGEKPAPLFYNEAFGKYHAAVEDGLNTTTQKQMNFAQLLQLREVGVPIPDDELLDAATIQNKNKLIEKIQAQQQQAQQQTQQQNELQMAQMQSQIKLSDSTVAANEGLAMERASRVEENHSLAIERLHAANKEDELALLNKIKALKEIDEMDLGHIERLLNMANMLTQAEANKSQELSKQQVSNVK